MNKIYSFLIFAVCFAISAFAGVGNHDERYYVTDEMRHQHPYNKFVRLDTELGTCTAQYISRNLILSAGHCADVDKYTAVNHNDEKFEIKLIETPFSGSFSNDWAIFLVPDSKYYSDAYFDIRVPTKTIDVINAGYGWVRILSDEELDEIREILSGAQITIRLGSGEKRTEYINKALIEEWKKCMDYAHEQFNLCYDKPPAERIDCFTKAQKLYDNCPKDIGLSDTRNRLKASKCKILYKRDINNAFEFPDILPSTCDSWTGNSGGGYISIDGKNLYGICSYGNSTNEFTDSWDKDYMAVASQFDKRTKKLIEMFNSDDFISTNKNITEILAKNLPTEHTDNTQKPRSTMDNRIQKLSKETDDLASDLISHWQKVKDMDNKQLLNFLDKVVEHQVKSERLFELQKKYEEAKTREQSFENRALTALTVAATGIGGMQLAQGLSEQRADKDADADMTAYMATMRCSYGDGKSVNAGDTPIELPGGNDEKLMNLRNEYFSLATSLKERKEALGMKPGIESETILDKSQIGLYSQENIGIIDGAYGSLYRAKMGNETDQAKIDEDKDVSSKRVKGGGIATGVGVVGGIVGNQLINGKTSE